MTPKKSTSVILAGTLGWLGVHRFYLGHSFRAFLLLIYPIIILGLLLYFTNTLAIARTYLTVELSTKTLVFLLPILLIPWLDGLFLATRSSSYFSQQSGWKPLPGIPALLIALLVNAAGYYFVWLPDLPTAAGKPSISLSADSLGHAYAADFTVFDQQIIAVTGQLTAEETLLQENKAPIRVLIMDNTPTPILLHFTATQQTLADTLTLGRTVQVKGICRAEFDHQIILEDCRLME